MKTFLYFFSAILFFTIIAAMAQENVQPVSLDVEKLVAEALQKNPSLDAARQEYRAKSLMIRTARALPDPMLELGIMSIPVNSFALNKEDMTQTVIGITQIIPYPGKLKLAEAVARSDADAAKEQIRAYENRLRFDVRRTYLQWVFAEEAARITKRGVADLRQSDSISTSRYSVGMGTQWDALTAQVEKSKLEAKLSTISQNVESLKALLASLLGRDAPRVEGAPEVKWTPVIKLDENELIKKADEHNPTIAYLKVLSEKSDNSARLARRERLPNFSVNVQYGIRQNGPGPTGETMNRPDLLTALVGIEVPLWSGRKQTPMLQSAEAMSMSARRTLADEQLRDHAYIRDRVLRIKRADEIETLYRTGILPQSRTTVQSAFSSYQVGKIDFQALITSQLNLLNHELDYYEVRVNREIDLAELELLVGEPIGK